MPSVMTKKNVVAIIVAAGSGNRSGLAQPKQYERLGGRAVLDYSYAALSRHPMVDRVVVVIGEGQQQMATKALAAFVDEAEFVVGGADRRASVLNGLKHVERTGRAENVLIHDAARPFLPAPVVDRLIEALGTHDGAIPVLPLSDTLVRGQDGMMVDGVSRESLYRVQTPQAFRFRAILQAHLCCSADAPITDDAGLLHSMGVKVALVEGDPKLEKLTYSADFDCAQTIQTVDRQPRTGMGFDVHRLVAGKPLWLCGVEIAHSHGLSGHSDADVGIHAMVDALLGALADGDIGSHFSPTDPQWRDAPSHRFLTFARDRVKARGGMISHIDLTIICEIPRIGPHRAAMRARAAQLLDIPIQRVSVKATTTEKLGFAGRGEGIAAQAVATIMLPNL